MSDVDAGSITPEIQRGGSVGLEETPAVAGALDASQHHLEPNAIGLVQSTVISIASSAPTAALAISLAPLVVISARGAAISVLLTLAAMNDTEKTKECCTNIGFECPHIVLPIKKDRQFSMIDYMKGHQSHRVFITISLWPAHGCEYQTQQDP